MTVLMTGRIEAARTLLKALLNGPITVTERLDLEAALTALAGYQRVRDAMVAHADDWDLLRAGYVLRLLAGEAE